MHDSKLKDIEINLFLEALRLRHGYDFSHYARASLQRRLEGLVITTGHRHLSELIPRLLHEPELLKNILSHISVPVTAMFRDPPTFMALRHKVVPILRTYPRINVWQVGSATGEEAYSLAILLAEEGIYDKVQIYATDINDDALGHAEEGIFPAKQMQNYSRNYLAAGGTGSLADYFHVRYEFARLDPSLKANIVFAHHNLVSDGVFCEAHLVLCRNLLIYFDSHLQEQVLELFRASLVRSGFLCLGNRESLASSQAADHFADLDQPQRIYRLLEPAPPEQAA